MEDLYHEIKDVPYDQRDERFALAVKEKDYDFLVRVVWNLTRAQTAGYMKWKNIHRRHFDDLFSFSILGVWKAAVKFDGSTSWPAYAKGGADYERLAWVRHIARKKNMYMRQLSEEVAGRISQRNTSRYFVY